MLKLTKKIVVAVDGFSSCGKSTFAKKIANELGYIFIDTGAMYRSISLFAIQNQLVDETGNLNKSLIDRLPQIKIRFKRDEFGRVFTFLNDVNVESDIRGVEVSQLVSEVSKIKEVRQYLVKMQQEMGRQKGIVMDGRDIGTIVFPKAEVKIYMSASSSVRAKRRYDELTEKGIKVSYEEIKRNIDDRDFNDLNRKISPLKKAKDAVVLDNSNMTVEEQMIWFNRLLIEKNLIAKN